MNASCNNLTCFYSFDLYRFSIIRRSKVTQRNAFANAGESFAFYSYFDSIFTRYIRVESSNCSLSRWFEWKFVKENVNKIYVSFCTSRLISTRFYTGFSSALLNDYYNHAKSRALTSFPRCCRVPRSHYVIYFERSDVTDTRGFSLH